MLKSIHQTWADFASIVSTAFVMAARKSLKTCLLSAKFCSSSKPRRRNRKSLYNKHPYICWIIIRFCFWQFLQHKHSSLAKLTNTSLFTDYAYRVWWQLLAQPVPFIYFFFFKYYQLNHPVYLRGTFCKAFLIRYRNILLNRFFFFLFFNYFLKMLQVWAKNMWNNKEKREKNAFKCVF